MKKKILAFVYPTALILFLLAVAGIGFIHSLSENQTLYFSSTLAQVSATLFGLTITAYAFIEGKLSKDAEKDDSFVDIANELTASYRRILLVGTFLTGIALILCMSNILVGDYSKLVANGWSYRFLVFVLNNSFTFSMASIVCSLYFTYKATDPKRIEKANRRVVSDNQYITGNETAEKEKNYFVEFLTNYNELEKQITSFVHSKKNIDNTYPVLSKSIYYLKNTGVIDYHLFVRLHEIRQFRNSLVHGTNPFVSESTFNVLVQLTDEIIKILEDHEVSP